MNRAFRVPSTPYIELFRQRTPTPIRPMLQAFELHMLLGLVFPAFELQTILDTDLRPRNTWEKPPLHGIRIVCLFFARLLSLGRSWKSRDSRVYPILYAIRCAILYTLLYLMLYTQDLFRAVSGLRAEARRSGNREVNLNGRVYTATGLMDCRGQNQWCQDEGKLPPWRQNCQG